MKDWVFYLAMAICGFLYLHSGKEAIEEERKKRTAIIELQKVVTEMREVVLEHREAIKTLDRRSR